MILFMKSKNPQERAEAEAAKVRFLRMKIEGEKQQMNLQGIKERKRNAEIRRLRA
jgi:hypothetical protein